jgi:hypothetical protein
MRFAVLIVSGVATGALFAGAIQTMIPQNTQMFQAVRALGGDPTNFRITDINPLKAYEYVNREIISGNLGGSINLDTWPAVISLPKVGSFGLGNSFHIDDAARRRAVGAGINSRIQ